ncbi:MAG: S8 family serine peptidase [Planctomycetota bacterium]|nr:S8 family serine peptidase [Planctomycetota bacterium]
MPIPTLVVSSLLQVCLAGSASGAADAPAPVWVFFKDDRATPASIADTALTPRALARRALRRTLPGLFDIHDVPMPATRATAVTDTGAQLRAQSRWLCAVSAMATPKQIEALRGLPDVTHVEAVGRGRAGWQDEQELPPPEGWTSSMDYGAANPQLAQIDIPRLHARGDTGAGIVIGILDTGFNRVHDAFNNPAHPLRVIAEWDFINNDGNTGIQAGDNSEQHKHGTWILGTIAAYLPGTMVGGAYDAEFILCKTEDVPTETPIEEDYYVAGLEFIEARGADVATSSLGYIDWYTQADLNGHTAVTTVAVNVATANGVVCCTAAGNAGHDTNPATSTIIAPADAYNVLTCGAVDINGAIVSFSSSGPTADGRLKPEILACGLNTVSVNSTNTTGLSGLSGTSLSTPLVAAAVACILQARPDYGVAQIREALFATASRSDAAGLHPDPLFVEGHGILRAYEAAIRGRRTADLNLDGFVNGIDLGLMLGAWGQTGVPGFVFGDITLDGSVGGGDLGALLGQW